MKRRDFIKYALMSGAYAGTLKLGGFKAFAAAPSGQTTLVNLVLGGGPDLRHLFVPAYSSDTSTFGYQYWNHRFRAHDISNSETAWQNRYNDDYTPLNSNGTTFGILNKAGWLKDQFQAGNVAIINNVIGATTRDHSQAMLTLESGDSAVGSHDFNRDGWGGRLVQNIGGNVVSMTTQVRLFCNGATSNSFDHDNTQVISCKDSRNMSLYHSSKLDTDPAAKDARSIMSRALKGYYQAKRNDVGEESPFYKFINHEKTFREFGDAIDARLDDNPIPASIEALYSGADRLNSTYLGKQFRNLLDSYICSDILDYRVASMELGGWDSHGDQADRIEPKLEDMFGDGKGFDTFTTELQTIDPTAYDNMAVVISGEFGRQLSDNGDGGTDHGRGNSIIVIGSKVNGGIYGDMFPESDVPRFDKPSADINGLTSIEHVFGALSDWVSPGAGDVVFPGRGTADLESGVDLSNLVNA